MLNLAYGTVSPLQEAVRLIGEQPHDFSENISQLLSHARI